MKQIPFDKYRVRGAYHWEWYRSNKHNYRTYADQTLGYFHVPGSLLDIGCGDGMLSYLFFRHGFVVDGIDINSTGVELGRETITKNYFMSHPFEVFQALSFKDKTLYLENKGIRLRELSIYDLPDDRKYDYAICMEVIEHVPEPRMLIDKILGVIRGYAVLSTPNGDYCKPGEEDYQFWTPAEFIKLFSSEQAELLQVNHDRIFVRLSC